MSSSKLFFIPWQEYCMLSKFSPPLTRHPVHKLIRWLSHYANPECTNSLAVYLYFDFHIYRNIKSTLLYQYDMKIRCLDFQLEKLTLSYKETHFLYKVDKIWVSMKTRWNFATHAPKWGTDKLTFSLCIGSHFAFTNTQKPHSLASNSKLPILRSCKEHSYFVFKQNM